MAKHNDIGFLGEKIAQKFLKKHGYTILDYNYRKKFGEIDVIAKKDKIITFIEVKSVSYATNSTHVIHETDQYRPEDNVHPQKLLRLSRIIQSYLSEYNVSDETEWNFGIITVRLFLKDKKAKVDFLKDIII